MKTSSRPQISVEDVRKWGIRINGPEQAKKYYVVRVPKGTEVLNAEGKVIDVSSENIIAIEEKANVVIPCRDQSNSISVNSDNIPTLADVRKWNAMKQNLSEEDNGLFDAYITRQAGYWKKLGNKNDEGYKTKMTNDLYRDPSALKEAIREERSYQAKNEDQRRVYDNAQMRELREACMKNKLASFKQNREARVRVRKKEGANYPTMSRRGNINTFKMVMISVGLFGLYRAE